MLLKQSTTRNKVILMVGTADHITGLAGLTLTITASKNGAGFLAITPVVTDLGSGLYNLALTTTHTNTLGDFALHITGAAADPTDLVDQVVLALPGDLASVLGTALTEGAAGRLAAALSAFLDVAAPVFTAESVNQTGDSFTRLGAPAGASIAVDIDALPTAIENADALLGRDLSAVAAPAARSLLNAVRFLRNKWTVVAGTLTVFKEDDTTSAWTAAVATDATADPIVSNDPA